MRTLAKITVSLLLLSSLAFGQWQTFHAQNVAAAGGGSLTTKTITIDHTKAGSADSTNFPLLVSGTYTYLKTVGNGGSIQNTVAQPLYSLTVPADLRFSTVSGCASSLLKWEFETYSASTGAVNIWVQVPTLSHTVDTVIYLCYGDATISTWQGGAFGTTWDANYDGVYHMANGSTLSTLTAVGTNDLTNNNAVAAGSGQIDGDAVFTAASSRYLTSPGTMGVGSSITVELWRFIASASKTTSPAFNLATDSPSSRVLAHIPYTDDTLYWDFGTSTAGAGRVSTNYTAFEDAWTHVVLVYDNGTGDHRIYLNGTSVANNTSSNSYTGTTGWTWGKAVSASTYDNGSYDEIRVSVVARSASYVLASYNNQNSPSTFYTVTP